ncbi:MAG: PilT/PilU family type 4a pilus ATPase [Gammaproteobacteria bacterium]|jgi:twitching motility protein PilU|nr:PilT/PilU family type 4a pilus ATPase [Gammaproteobacteria bacterium]
MSESSEHLRTWLKLLHDRGGSDLFVTAGAAPTVKIEGNFHPILSAALTDAQTRKLVLESMSEQQLKEFMQTHECQYALALNEDARFRVSAFYQQGQIGMVCRRIETRIPTVEELELPPILLELAEAKRGIIILVGATGTGKSTTLAAMVGHRNKTMPGHIVTIEDPIEFVHQHDQCIITQREVGTDTDSFEVALRNTLRQAPDVILIGEIRTRETMEHAMTFAETGHLVFSTLHANNANQAMDRIMHFFPESQREQVFLDLSFNLRAMIAQQLIPAADRERRHPVLEILLNTPLVKEKIRHGEVAELKKIMKDSEHHGMLTFDQALLKLHLAGKIDYEQALRHADSANEVRLAVKLAEGRSVNKLDEELHNISILDNESH